MPPLHKDIYKVIEENYGDVDDDKTVASALKVVRDYHDGINKKEIDDLYRDWWAENRPNYPFVEDLLDDGAQEMPSD